MQWDIFGRKKTEQAILELIGNVNKLQEQHSDLADLLKAHNDQITKLIANKVVEIPVLKPRIRNPEDIYRKERKKEEPDAREYLFKN